MNRRFPGFVAILAFIALIACQCLSGQAFAAENRGHGAPAAALPAELKNVAVQDRFLPAGTREVGLLQTVAAHVVVARNDFSQAYFAANGDKLYEKDVIFTLKASKCRIKLHNDDIITLGDNSRLAVKEVAGTRDTAEKKSALSLARGKAMFYAIRLLKHTGLTMEVESPTAVVGVRGTKFGVEVALEGDKAMGSLPLLLADNSENWGRYLLAQAGGSPGVTTTVHGFDGSVSVTATATGTTTSVAAGQSLTVTPVGFGELMPTPPAVSRSFQTQTNVPPPAAGSGSGQATAEGGGASQAPAGGGQSAAAGDDGGAAPVSRAAAAARTDDPIGVRETVNLPDPKEINPPPKPEVKVDPIPDPKTNTSGNHVGYFAAMLTNATAGALEEVFVSRNRYDGDSGIWARGIKSPEQDHIRAQGNGQQFDASPSLKWVTFQSGAKSSGDLADGYPISSTTLTRRPYMEWGFATVPRSFPADGSDYVIDNRIYWIFGQSTPAATLTGFTGTASYSGKAFGTFWSATGGINMEGLFKCDVTFAAGSNQVTNFLVSVHDTSAQASTPAGGLPVHAFIEGASGTIGPDGHFTIDPATGTWTLNGTTPDQKSAVGSLYGATATSMGGVWGMVNSSQNTGAAGIFQGDRPFAVQQGFLTGMLETGAGSYTDTFFSRSMQDFKSTSAFASSLSGSFVFDGSGTDKFMTELATAGGIWPTAVGDRRVMQFTKVDANAFMEWGTWTQPIAMPVQITAGQTTDFVFKNEGWYIWGEPTTEAQMATLKQGSFTATYNGTAQGAFFAAGGPGTRLAGTFNGTVNLAPAPPGQQPEQLQPQPERQRQHGLRHRRQRELQFQRRPSARLVHYQPHDRHLDHQRSPRGQFAGQGRRRCPVRTGGRGHRRQLGRPGQHQPRRRDLPGDTVGEQAEGIPRVKTSGQEHHRMDRKGASHPGSPFCFPAPGLIAGYNVKPICVTSMRGVGDPLGPMTFADSWTAPVKLPRGHFPTPPIFRRPARA